MSKRTPIIDMQSLIKFYVEQLYLSPLNKDENLELEVKFATRGVYKISRIDYNNAIQRLLSNGFTISKPQNMLRIFNVIHNTTTGERNVANIRTEINGMGNISKYCKTNVITEDMTPIFQQKNNISDGETMIYPINNDDFNFRTALTIEKLYYTDNSRVKNMLDTWSNNKKTFRYISRNTLTHDDYPFNIDVSIVKKSKEHHKKPVAFHTFIESNTLKSLEHYEIEIEFNNDKIIELIKKHELLQTIKSSPSTSPSPSDNEKSIKMMTALLNKKIKKAIRYILSGLQETNYPISYPEMNAVIQDYMKVLWQENYKEDTKILPRNFIGPSQYTLQMQNIIPLDENINVANIRNNYTVTEKADGDRKLLFINNSGKLYLITTNMNVQFTGAKTDNTELFNTLIDGEHILYNKKREFINLYAAFDIYYINNKDVRTLEFTAAEMKTQNYRLVQLTLAIKNLHEYSIINKGKSPITLKVKTFYLGTPQKSIFTACNSILQKEVDGLFDYETDGLIFTPASFGVGSESIGKTTNMPTKTTWVSSFKWKPVEYNTIDFLVSFKKNDDGQDFIGNIFQNGTNMSSGSQIRQYKTAILRVGYDEKKHGYINPCQNIINAEYSILNDSHERSTYKPVQFYPSNPTDMEAGICNILLENGPSNNKIMKTIEGDIIEDNMIVEFRYVKEKDKYWRWLPLRVRYDKTADLRTTGRNFGNAYHVANSNWHTIHHPITNDMIRTGTGIPENIVDEEVYYNVKSGDSLTKGLREFHNMYVKDKLIKETSARGNTLIDLAVGKGGDLPKWRRANLSFVFGVDISPDNIQNRIDGACARYLNNKKKFKTMHNALFVTGNSAHNIRNTTGIRTFKGKQITNAVFGKGAKDIVELGQGVYDNYGIGKDGFDICSIQFAIHYMFENKNTLHNFLRNVSETTKVGGYFIGTSYDGTQIFQMLSDKNVGEEETLYFNQQKMWSITKEYEQETFYDDERSLGYAINVFQESINKSAREYLVNYEYLTRMISNYGFEPITDKEAKQLNMNNAIGSFKSLYNTLEKDAKHHKYLQKLFEKSLHMSEGEKKISFLNKYFIYKKIRNVDAEAIAKNFIGLSLAENTTDPASVLGSDPASDPAVDPASVPALDPASVPAPLLASSVPITSPQTSVVGDDKAITPTPSLPGDSAPISIAAPTAAPTPIKLKIKKKRLTKKKINKEKQ